MILCHCALVSDRTVRRAVAQSPAPAARPTSAVSAEPTPNASGTIRNSSRAEMP